MREVAQPPLAVFLSGLAALSELRRLLLLARDAGRLKCFAPPGFGDDAFMLHTARESSQHRLEAFAFSVFYLYQRNSFLL